MPQFDGEASEGNEMSEELDDAITEIREWLDEIVPGEPTDHLRVVAEEKPFVDDLLQALANVKVDDNCHVICVYCIGEGEEGFDADKVAFLATRLPHLKSFDAMHTNFTDKGMESLAKCSTLREVNIADTGVTGVGLRFLRDLTELRELV